VCSPRQNGVSSLSSLRPACGGRPHPVRRAIWFKGAHGQPKSRKGDHIPRLSFWVFYYVFWRKENTSLALNNLTSNGCQCRSRGRRKVLFIFASSQRAAPASTISQRIEPLKASDAWRRHTGDTRSGRPSADLCYAPRWSIRSWRSLPAHTA
jgi:hypothetical protein